MSDKKPAAVTSVDVTLKLRNFIVFTDTDPNDMTIKNWKRVLADRLYQHLTRSNEDDILKLIIDCNINSIKESSHE